MISEYEKLIMKNNQSIVDKEKLKMKNWEEKKVEDCLDKSRFSVGKIKTAEVKETGNFPVIDQSQNYIAGYSNKKEYLYDGKLPVIIYGDHTNNVKHIDFRFIQGADGIKILVPNEKIDSRYFFYALNLYKPESKGYRRHYSILRKIKIKFPNSLPEQRRIVSKLDALFAEIDASLALIDQNIEQAEALKLSVLDEEFGKIKDREALKEITKVVGGGTPKTKIKEYWNGNIVWLSPKDLPPVGVISNVSDSSRKITDIGLRKSSAKLLPKGTVCYSSRASIGKIAIAETELCTNQGFTNFICKEGIYNCYLAYALKLLENQIINLSNSTTFKEVSKTSFKNFEIPVTNYKHQQKIVQKLDTLFEEIDGVVNDYKQKRANLEALKSSLLDQ